MAEFSRSLRIAELLKPALAELIRTRVYDPMINPNDLVISDIEVSTDLSYAKVYIRTMSDECDRPKIIRRLSKMSGFLRAGIGKSVRMKKIPQLRFCLDESVDTGIRIEQLLRRG